MIDLDYGVKLITRAEWGARQPTSITGINPSFGSTRHWEGPHMGDFPHESCATKVRGIQAFHMDSRGWTDIAYTGVACPHGYVFEGRGLWRRTAANGTNIGNNTAYAFCYLGGELDPFTEGGKRALKAGMNWTARSGGAGPGRNDHNDWKATQCPGVVIETWGDTGELLQEEDSLSAEEVADIKKHIDLTVRPFFAQDYDRDDDRVWVDWRNGTKSLVPQPGETEAEQAAPGISLMTLNHVRSDGVWSNGYPRPFHRSKAELDLLVTVGPVPPGWETES